MRDSRSNTQVEADVNAAMAERVRQANEIIRNERDTILVPIPVVAVLAVDEALAIGNWNDDVMRPFLVAIFKAIRERAKEV